MKFVYILRIGLCYFLAFMMAVLGINNLFDADDAEDVFKDSVCMESPAILPENEGKILILTGKLSLEEPAADDEFGLTFDSLAARRIMETYVEETRTSVEEDDKGKKQTREYVVYYWAPVSSEELLLPGTATLNGIPLPEDLLGNVQFSNEKELDAAAVEAAGMYFYEDKLTADYLTDDPAPDKGESPTHVGRIRYYYKTSELTDGAEVTVVARQKDGVLDRLEGTDVYSVSPGILKIEDLQKTAGRGSVVFAVIEFLAAAGLVVRGILLTGRMKEEA